MSYHSTGRPTRPDINSLIIFGFTKELKLTTIEAKFGADTAVSDTYDHGFSFVKSHIRE